MVSHFSVTTTVVLYLVQSWLYINAGGKFAAMFRRCPTSAYDSSHLVCKWCLSCFNLSYGYSPYRVNTYIHESLSLYVKTINNIPPLIVQVAIQSI